MIVPCTCQVILEPLARIDLDGLRVKKLFRSSGEQGLA